ncbi:MAG: hypothetical protein AAB598_01685 [Patescibacteria group bacterium]
MSIINENFYRLEGVVPLLKKMGDITQTSSPRRLWLRRFALLENLNNYYRFSVSSVMLFQESIQKSVNALSEDKKTDCFDDESHSSAIAFYSHCRVCLESSRLLFEEAIFSSANDDHAKLLQQHRDNYVKWAREVIEKRNDITAHPHNVRKMIVGSPSSWGTNGKVTFNIIDLEHITIPEKVYELDPAEDLLTLKKYTEEAVSHLRLIWGI